MFQEVRCLLYGALLCDIFSHHLSLCLRLSFSVFIIPSPFDCASPPSSSWPLIPPVISFLFLISILTPALLSVLFYPPSRTLLYFTQDLSFLFRLSIVPISMLPVLTFCLTLHYIFRMNSYWRTYNFTPGNVFSFYFHFCSQINCVKKYFNSETLPDKSGLFLHFIPKSSFENIKLCLPNSHNVWFLKLWRIMHFNATIRRKIYTVNKYDDTHYY